MEQNNNVNIHQALVTDNQDPDGLGRVRVAIASIDGGNDFESHWLPVLSPFAGNESGIFCLPELENIVIVMFFDMDHRSGVVLGSLYNENIIPPKTEENSSGDLNDDGNNNLHFIRSRSGQRIILDDTDGKEKIQLLGPDAKTRFEILTGDELISLETDKNIHISANGVLNIEADEISIKTKKAMDIQCNSAQCESDKDITLKGSNNLTLEGQTIKLN